MKNEFVVVISSILKYDEESNYIIHGEFKRFSSPDVAIGVSSCWNHFTNKLRSDGDKSSPRSNQWAMAFMVNEDSNKPYHSLY
tara:strand:- start:2882 stop:3130 length:249 start_codon:yes stop_codon:yes gene_type:complete